MRNSRGLHPVDSYEYEYEHDEREIEAQPPFIA
jgi:hypothetical protein